MSSSQSTALHVLPSRSIFGHSKNLTGPDFFNFLIQTHEDFGPFIELKVPGRKLILIGNSTLARELIQQDNHLIKGLPYKKLKDLLGSGLVTSEGENWQSHRESLKQTFSPQGVQKFIPDIIDSVLKRIETWKTLDSQNSLDLGDEMRRLTLEIIVRSLLGASISKQQGDIAQAFHVALDLITETNNKPLSAPKWIPTSHNRKLNASLSKVKEFIQSVTHDNSERSCPLSQVAKQANWSEMEFTDEVINLLFAGHETTAQALTWSFINQNRFPNWINEIRTEWLSQPLPKTLADVNRFQKTKAFVQEVLRLYSPVPCFAREASAPIHLSNVTFKKGTLFLVLPQMIHRCQTEWGIDASNFDPNRFLGNSNGLSQRAFVPFSMGKRNCIGIHFAQTELIILLGLISLQGHFQIEEYDGIKPRFSGTLTTSHPVRGRWNSHCLH